MSCHMAHVYDYFKHSQTTEIPSSLTKEEVKQADELVEKVREASEPKRRGKEPKVGNMLQKMALQEQLDFFTALEEEYSRSYSKASEG